MLRKKIHNECKHKRERFTNLLLICLWCQAPKNVKNAKTCLIRDVIKSSLVELYDTQTKSKTVLKFSEDSRTR